MKCLNCNKQTNNPKFCSRSCSAIFNNALKPKRQVEGTCAQCKTPIRASRKYCKNCFSTRPWFTKKQTNGYEYVKSFRQRNKIKAVKYLGGKCKVCGYDKCYQALDFHHTNPNKKSFTISANTSIAWSRLVKELDKCILICANCHREFHAGIISL